MSPAAAILTVPEGCTVLAVVPVWVLPGFVRQKPCRGGARAGCPCAQLGNSLACPRQAKTASDAIEATLKRAVGALQGRRVPFLLGGSLAVWARGGPESCNDLDLIVRSKDADGALEALEEAGMRPERPPEDWLFKAWDGEVLVDLIFAPKGLQVDDAMFERSEPVSVFGLEVRAMTLEDVLITKLRALHEHYLDYDPVLEMACSVHGSASTGIRSAERRPNRPTPGRSSRSRRASS